MKRLAPMILLLVFSFSIPLAAQDPEIETPEIRTESSPETSVEKSALEEVAAEKPTAEKSEAEKSDVEHGILKPNLYLGSLQAAMGALQHYGVWDDPEELRRVSEIAYRLAAEADWDEYPVSVYLIDMPEPNAFALPGGQIFVTRGMLGLGLDDDMLANLLGHELAHVIKSHGTKMKRRATLLNLLSQALLVGVIAGVDDDDDQRNPYSYHPYDSGRSRKGSLVEGTLATGMVVTELLLRNYSRDFEDEADREGQRYAAGAGYDPDGARTLWELMNERLPSSREYGYWRTHPFSDQRERSAGARAKELTIREGASPDELRRRTQQRLLAFAESDVKPLRRANEEKRAQIIDFLHRSALLAWPVGPEAEKLRLAELHRLRDELHEESEVQRDYGELIRTYRAEMDQVRALTPDSPFLAVLENETAALAKEAEEVRPKALEVWREGFYQTPFLENFLSNYPDAEEAPQMALALGDAYSRLRREADAVEQYLKAFEADPDSEAGRRAFNGLKNLAPYLEKLSALYQLAVDFDDAELSESAARRFDELAATYEEVANGGEFLQRHPDAPAADVVRERLEALAADLYGEVLLYQNIGEHMKALKRIEEILTYAPGSSAAELLRERTVLENDA